MEEKKNWKFKKWKWVKEQKYENVHNDKRKELFLILK